MPLSQPIISNPGKIEYFAMSTPPAGWLNANGVAVGRVAYAALFAAIGTLYGVGDGATTFNLPDLRGEFVRGWDNGRGIDASRGIGTGQTQDMQPHTHTFGEGYFGANTGAGYTPPTMIGGVGGPQLTNSTGVTETRPRNIALLACIKY